MKGKRFCSFVVAATLLLVGTVYAGGWAIMTIRDLPEDVVAGKPVRITFMARAHGVTPLTGLKPELTVIFGKETLKASAVATKTVVEYTATLVLPRPGRWNIQIAGIGYNHSTLTELHVRALGSPAPKPLSLAAQGKRLFVAKGCIGCHIKNGFDPNDSFDVGPNLAAKTFPEAYLKSFLANPQALPGRDAESERGEMPNLELKQSEIAALIAFINEK
jgi:mono/diheme cytochrome c family protein